MCGLFLSLTLSSSAPHSAWFSNISVCFCKPPLHTHTHIDEHTYTGPHAPLVLNAEQCWCIAEDRTDIWFCLLLISLKGQTKSFPSVSPVSLNTIWWSHTTVTELNKKQLFFTQVISPLIYSLRQCCIVYWRKEFLNCFDKGNLPGLEMYQVCFMHLRTAALWAHTHAHTHTAHPWSNGIFIMS